MFPPKQMRKEIFISFSLACLLLAACQKKHAAPPKAASDFSGPEFRGEGVYTRTCSQCHYAYKPYDLHGPGLAGLFNKDNLPSGAPATDDVVRGLVRNGHSKMQPARLSDKELDELIAYLHTL
jgi:mono/diheme cytochrome c family protein